MSEKRPADDRTLGMVELAGFRQSLLELGIVEQAELDAISAGIPESEGLLGLARVLQQAGRLTGYQAAALYQGKGRGLLIGNYLILDKLGAGGMGVVFKARHRRLGRVVALKILPPSFARDRSAVMRFKREVEAAGRLKHPNIVAALDADENRGVHFLVMEYVEGNDLDRVVRERGPLTMAEAIDHIVQAARGLEAAHAQGIVHRDIKPSNLMLDSSGVVRVLDLGLALIVDEANPFGQAAGTRLTQSGMCMGTVDYMSPEQAEDSRRADHRADIYSLGCTLYYLLTGREPFTGDTTFKRLLAHMQNPAPSLKAARPDTPIALEDLYQRMMAKNPADRPASMTEVIARLEECRSAAADAASSPNAGVSGSPKRVTTFDELGMQKTIAASEAGRDAPAFARRTEADPRKIGSELTVEDLAANVRTESPLVPPPIPTIRRAIRPIADPAVAARPGAAARARRINLAIQAAAVLLIVGFAGLLVMVSRRGSAPEPAEAGPRPVREAHDFATAAGPGRPESSATSGVPVTRMVARTIFDGKSPDGWMLTNRKRLDPRHVQPDGLNPHGTGSYLVVYHEKLGDFVLDFDYKLSPGCHSGVFVRVGDLGDPVHTGIKVALGDSTGATDRDPGAFYDLVAPSRNAQKPAGQWNHMTITAEGPRLSVSLNGEPVTMMNVDAWTIPGKRPDGTPHQLEGLAVASLPRSGYIGFQDLKGDCWFRHVVLRSPGPPSMRAEGSITGGRSGSADGTKPASTSAAADSFGIEPLVEVGRITEHDHIFEDQVHIVPDGKRMLTTCFDGRVRIWDIASGRQLRRLSHPEAVRPAALLPDGRPVVTGCQDGWVRLWDMDSGKEMRRLVKHDGRVWGLAVSSDGKSVVSAAWDGVLRVTEIGTARGIQSFEPRGSQDWSAAVSPDGRRIFAGCEDGVLRLITLGQPTRIDLLTGQPRRAAALGFAPDGRHAVSSAYGQLAY